MFDTCAALLAPSWHTLTRLPLLLLLCGCFAPAVSVEGASIPLPFDPELWKLSQATHKCWQGAKLPSSCTFYNLHGSGLDTPYDVQYGSWWYTVQVGVGRTETAAGQQACHHHSCLTSLHLLADAVWRRHRVDC